VAVSVLATQDWRLEAVTAAIDSGRQQTIALGQPLPVFLIYMTAMPGADGEIAYGSDVYRRDGAVVAALDAPDAALARQAAAAPIQCAARPMP
jgi:murein L,D-transpeptidase YcbB/YkuD